MYPKKALACLTLGVLALIPGHSVRASTGAATIGPTEDESDPGGSTRVDVVVDLTDAGRKVAPPTPATPVYFLPVPQGYKEVGYEPYFGSKRTPPAQSDIETMLYRALAQQGYQVMTHQNHPSIVLGFTWGYMAPSKNDPQQFAHVQSANGSISSADLTALSQASTESGTAAASDAEMRDLVAGNTFGDETNPADPRKQEALQMAKAPRYYIYVAALDFDSWLKNYKELRSGQKNPFDKPILLWRAHVSCELWGHYFDQVAQTLVTSGAPWFGRETKRPEIATEPLMPMGRVILGTPEVKGFSGH